MINVEHVTKIYDGKKVLDDISFNIEPGEIIALVGPNGAGKTTLISILLGLVTPTSGDVTIFEKKPTNKKLSMQIGAMLQESTMFPSLKVNEVAELFQSYYPNPISLNDFYRFTDLEKQAKTFSEKLSGGQKRRLSFGLAMIGNPQLIFLDEPTTGMDVISRKKFWEQVDSLIAMGKTVILTTHYLEEVEQVADRIILMKEGRIIHDGNMKTLRAQMMPTQVRFTFVGNGIPEFKEYPGVTQIHTDNQNISIQSTKSDETVIELIKNGVAFRDLQVLPTSLEEVFTTMVSEKETVQ